MSKAFVKENDNEDDDSPAPEGFHLPKGTKNYMTPSGAKVLQEEYHRLITVDRPKMVETVSWAASNGDRSENGDYIYGKRKLREIDRRLRFISKRLDKVEIVDPSKQKSDRVLFGATVTVEDEDGLEKIYQIVGIDETNAAKGRVSWISPVGKALLQSREGDAVTVKVPKGEVELEIKKIEYK